MNKREITFLDYDGSILKSIYNKKIKKPNNPKRYFYKFDKWELYNSDSVTYIAKYKSKKNTIENEKEFYSIINDIINNEEYLKRKNYKHHGNTSVYQHCLDVAYYTYKMCKKLGLDYKSATIGAILHDFYYKEWQTLEKRPLFKKHGFVHAGEALENSRKVFPLYLNSKIENCILRHMFPLNIHPPKYREAWIVSIADKYVSMDVIKNYKILLSFFISRK